MKLPPPIARLAERVERHRAVALSRRVLETYDRAGGALLAGGLTYAALFALLPSILLLVGLLGFVIDDPERRQAVVEGIGRALPPLQGIVAEALVQITEGRAGFGLAGLLGLAWGASRFYGSLDDAFGRIFRNAPRRSFVARLVGGFLSVVLLVSVFLVALALTGITSYLADQTARRLGSSSDLIWQVATPMLTAALFTLSTAFLYKVVPARRTSWRAIRLPAIVVGIGLALLTQLFTYIAPRLIGTAALFGTFVAIFAAMVWLSFMFQALLLGAAWVRERLEDEERSAGLLGGAAPAAEPGGGGE